MQSKLLKNIVIFVIGTVFNKGLNFFILPILTYYLTKEDYGMLGLITSVSTIAVIYIGFFPSTFIMVKFNKFGKEKMAEYISNIIVLILLSFVAVSLILYMFREDIFADYGDTGYLVVYVTLLCLFQVFWQQVSTIIQLEKDAIKYVWYQFIQTTLTIGLALLLIIEFSWGWEGKFFAELSVYFLSALYALYYLFRNDYITFNIERKKLAELFHYLFPLSFYVVGLYIMGTVDKVFLANMVGLEAAGIYAIAITMTIVINMVFDAVLKAWEPYLFELLNHNSVESDMKVVKITYLYMLFVVLSMVVYILLIPYLFAIMIDEKFDQALAYIPVLVVAYSFEGLRKPVTEILNHLNKVKTVGGVTIFAAVLNIILNVVLIKMYGVIGAAYATLISFVVLFVLTFYFVIRYSRLPWLLSLEVKA